ncbi:MAG: hypothetical protein M1820_001294 [Bogoriella megaspora]|nr:MAG: hypothetical protein M1820_001294 [Bogoriella megaspora]
MARVGGNSRTSRVARGHGSQKANELEPSSATKVYNELLAETASSSPTLGPERPLKRRKLWRQEASKLLTRSSPSSNRTSSRPPSKEPENVQTVLTETEQSDDEDDEFEWEDALTSGKEISPDLAATGTTVEGVSLDLKDDTVQKKKPRKRHAAILDRKTRIHAHKAHLLSLMMHVFLRNSWCNDGETQGILARLLPSHVRSLLLPAEHQSQHNKDRFFKQGLNELKDVWKLKFQTVFRGMKQPSWLSYVQPASFQLPADTETLVDIRDFRDAARNLEGSQDTGVQLLCSLMRSIGVTTRLVCSLQLLGFAMSPRDLTDQADQENTSTGGITEAVSGSEEDAKSNKSIAEKISQRHTKRRRIGQPSLGRTNFAPKPRKPRKRIYRTQHPVYWVEAFNEAAQKWVPVEPFSTDTVGKPSKLEPPTSHSASGIRMTYVIAFEEDGIAKDVTRRYASSYNAKTRKERVECTENGGRWLKRAMRVFGRPGRVMFDRDQLESAELARKEAQEGMPRAIQDFKNHPVYALERHLKRNEVIYPKREVGKVGAMGKAAKLEPVFRRTDVVVVRSADKWYRLGREIKAGEQPLKHLPPSKASMDNRSPSGRGDELFGEEGTGTPLYALFQTEPYNPPPCVRGKVPKNAYGNIDVYVPSMIPRGGKHIINSEAARAARILNIDYADAVTGFEFKGRRGTAVVQGVVVAEEYAEALEAVLESIAFEREQDEQMIKSDIALKMWKRFLIGLRIRERVNEYEIEGEKGKASPYGSNMSEEDDLSAPDEGGGFFADPSVEKAIPTAERRGKDSSDDFDEDYGKASVDESTSFDHTREHLQSGGFGEQAGYKSPQEPGGSFLDETENIVAPGRDLVSSNDEHRYSSTASNNEYSELKVDEDAIAHSTISSLIPTRSIETPAVRQQGQANSPLRSSSEDSSSEDIEMNIALAESLLTQRPNHSSPKSSQLSGQHDITDTGANSTAQAGSQGIMEVPSGGGLGTSTVKEDERAGQNSPIRSDQGSLLSHDPEDDEAEPDWLADI